MILLSVKSCLLVSPSGYARVVPTGDRTLGLPLQLTPKVQRPICLFETHVEEAQDSCSNHVWLAAAHLFGDLKVREPSLFSFHCFRTGKSVGLFLGPSGSSGKVESKRSVAATTSLDGRRREIHFDGLATVADAAKKTIANLEALPLPKVVVVMSPLHSMTSCLNV